MSRYAGAARAALASLVLYVAAAWAASLAAMPQSQGYMAVYVYTPAVVVAQVSSLVAWVLRLAAWGTLGAAVAMGLWALGLSLVDRLDRQ